MEKQAGLFPVLPGKDARSVAKVFDGRGGEYAEARGQQGVHMERAYEQVTPMGAVVVAYHESDRSFAETAASMAQSDHPIDKDFMAAIKDVHGVDPSQPPPVDPAR